MEAVMTRSIFDPGGGETEHSGSTFLGPDGQNASHLPPDVADGEVEGGDDDAQTLEAVDLAGDTAPPFTDDDEEAGRRLGEMTGDADQRGGQ
jgi:hypothetical protein